MSEQEWLNIFSDNLIEIMNEAGISQRELSRLTGLTQSNISRYITKRQVPPVKAIINIAYALNCSISELIDFGDIII